MIDEIKLLWKLLKIIERFQIKFCETMFQCFWEKRDGVLRFSNCSVTVFSILQQFQSGLKGPVQLGFSYKSVNVSYQSVSYINMSHVSVTLCKHFLFRAFGHKILLKYANSIPKTNKISFNYKLNCYKIKLPIFSTQQY